MLSSASPLSPALVDDVFSRLAALYGSRFMSQWDPISLPAVKDQWAYELREFADNPPAIEHGLNRLPAGFPPGALDFRDLCRSHARADPPTGSILHPMTDEDRARAVAILKTFKNGTPGGPLDWARRLRLRELSGERLTSFQRSCWREALSHKDDPPMESTT